MQGTELERLYIRIFGDKTHLDATYKQVEADTKKFAGNMATLGAVMTAAITAPLAKIGESSVNAFSDWDLAMTRSVSIMKVTEAQVEQMKKATFGLAGQFAQTPRDLAASYYYLASAGMNAEQAIAALPAVVKFATAGAFDLSVATELASSAQNALGMRAADATQNLINLTRVMDVVTRISKIAQGSTQEFAVALANDAGAAMKSLNIKLEEGVAVLGAYGDAGIRGAEAGSMLGRMLRLLASAANKHAAEFKKVGVSVFDAAGNMRPLADIIENLEQVLGKLSPQARQATMEMLGFKTLQQKAITPLLGSSEKIRALQKDLESAGGTIDAISKKQLKAFANQMALVKNQITIAAIEIGEILAPALEFLGNVIKEAVAGWRTLSPEMKRTIIVVAGVVASIGPLILALGTAAMMWGTITAGAEILIGLLPTIGPIIAGLALVIGGFVIQSGGVEKAWQNIQAAVKSFVDWATPVWTALVDFFVSCWPLMQQAAVFAFEWVKENFNRTVEGLRVYLGFMLGDFRMTWDQIRDTVVNAIQLATFAIENFELATHVAVAKVAKYFYDLTNSKTFGLAGVIDDYTLGIGKALNDQIAEGEKAFDEWKKKRAAAGTGLTGAPGADPFKPLVDQSKKSGAAAGKAFKDAMRGELEKIDAAMVGSAEAVFRIADYRNRLAGTGDKKGGIGGAPVVFDPKERGGVTGGDSKQEKLLKEIRDAIREREKNGIELDTADLEV